MPPIIALAARPQAATLSFMAADPEHITLNYECETEGNTLEHVLEDVHEILRLLHRLATPEAQALLDGLLSNPALKWKARRNGRASVQ